MSTRPVESVWAIRELSTPSVEVWATSPKPIRCPRPIHTTACAETPAARSASRAAPAVVHGSTPPTTIARDLHPVGVAPLRCELVGRTQREAP